MWSMQQIKERIDTMRRLRYRGKRVSHIDWATFALQAAVVLWCIVICAVLITRCNHDSAKSAETEASSEKIVEEVLPPVEIKREAPVTLVHEIKEEPPKEEVTEPVAESEVEVVEEPEPDPFEGFTKIADCKVTYYCAEERPHICNAGPPYITASGKKPRPGITCATDDLPMGATVLVDYDKDGEIDAELVCEDRFGGKQKNHVDICLATHKAALDGGRRTADVYWRAE